MPKAHENGRKPDSDAQHARFVETARKLGCDESEEAFDEKLKVIARHKLKDDPDKLAKRKQES